MLRRRRRRRGHTQEVTTSRGERRHGGQGAVRDGPHGARAEGDAASGPVLRGELTD